MTAGTGKDWQKEFGIRPAGPKVFFSTKLELNAPGTDALQGHVLRRAFDLLKLDGILCTENAPLVYFKEVKQIEPTEVARLHRTFWNHGGAPVLVLIAEDEVQIYSGLIRPAAQPDAGGVVPGLVETLDRTSAAIREFLPTVESGEFFRRHQKSFNPAHRVDRDLLDNLQATRDKLLASSNGALEPRVLNALLCRLVFACYLFDREIVGQAYLESIGLPNASHLRDVLALQPKTKAKKYLYDLFAELGRDFNGDLFSDNLDAEARLVSRSYIGPLDDFFRATDAVSGQGSFWPYDFAAIPVEAISAIYERFLQGSSKSEGAFYTPRFLAEVVLDMALVTIPSLLGHRYLDPACGSGIFLVGLFNRIAEEWKQANPEARNDRRARELRKILCTNLYGVDINPTACRITAFSLYLAYLDQLAPRDIQELQQKGHKLPKLVHYPDNAGTEVEGNIWCGDFFAEDSDYPIDADLVIGNPPWGSVALKGTSAAKWCAQSPRQYLIPDKQIAAAFIWKAAQHVSDSGRICLVLPYGTLFNHSRTTIDFQQTLFKRHAVDHVLNLVDYRFFLFAEALHPAIVMVYRKHAPKNLQHSIQYWAPKADGLVMQAEIITISPEDRSRVSVGEVLIDLEGQDAPQIWKQRFWATARDRRLINRLSVYPRLRDHVRQLKEKDSNKPWLIAVGVQPVRKGDDPAKAATIGLPSRLLIEATSSTKIDLFLLRDDCTKLPLPEFSVRSGSNKDTSVFKSPHVLVSKGFTSVAFADFDVSFQDFLRGIHGPAKDRDLLIFLTAYIRSRLAKYFLFHTASNWGVARQQVHVDELLRLPFPLPEALPDAKRSWEIVKEVSHLVAVATSKSSEFFSNREEFVRIASESIELLLDEYFDILPSERMLIDDTVEVIIPSSLPTRARRVIPTISPSTQAQQDSYVMQLCDTLNGWAKGGPFTVQAHTIASTKLGIGIAILRKAPAGRAAFLEPDDSSSLLAALERLRKVTSRRLNMFELVRGAKVFDRDHLYLVKPIGRRFWTRTAALNDADEIAGTILMYVPKEVA
jgi:type I restriction-modification system DNA methylase subunit